MERDRITVHPKQVEYLAEAWRIAHYQGNNRYVAMSDIADEMKVTAPAVTRMVQRLQESGYVIHEPYRGILLTETGEREALRFIRKHRIVERFLVDVMKFDWHEVHLAADQLGAGVSERVVERMAELAGHPARCPHGEPIPTRDGRMPMVTDARLNECANGEWVISRVNTHDEKRLQYIDALGLKPGASFQLIERAPFNGPIQIDCHRQRHFIGHELGQVLRVCKPHDYPLKFA